MFELAIFLKTYGIAFRSTMCDDILSNIAVLSTESARAESINLDSFVKLFDILTVIENYYCTNLLVLRSHNPHTDALLCIIHVITDTLLCIIHVITDTLLCIIHAITEALLCIIHVI